MAFSFRVLQAPRRLFGYSSSCVDHDGEEFEWVFEYPLHEGQFDFKRMFRVVGDGGDGGFRCFEVLREN